MMSGNCKEKASCCALWEDGCNPRTRQQKHHQTRAQLVIDEIKLPPPPKPYAGAATALA